MKKYVNQKDCVPSCFNRYWIFVSQVTVYIEKREKWHLTLAVISLYYDQEYEKLTLCS